MATLKEMQADLLERVKSGITTMSVEPFPDKPADYKLLHPVGAVLVRYNGGSYSQPGGMGFVRQDRRLDWELVVVTRSLNKGDGAAYPILDALRVLLTGYRLPDCDKLFPFKEEFLDEDNGIWQHTILFGCMSVNIEIPDEESNPLLKRITANDNLGNTTEVV